MKYGYARCSTNEDKQDIQRQIRDLKAAGAEEVVFEYEHGDAKVKGSINVQLAEKTGFTREDAQIVKEALRTLFANDASSARPDGSMEVVRLYWWEHSCKDGQYSSAKVHRLLNVHLKEEASEPTSAEDYVIELEELPGLACEVIEGM